MGYLHIDNLYKDQTILIFKECFALEKIHGTSAHIRWSPERGLGFFSGGEKHEKFTALFDHEKLSALFAEKFTSPVVVFGEAYGGKQQGMSHTYGKELKFIVFDIKVGETWLGVENAASLTESLGLEFVDFARVSTDLEILNAERDKPSVQAKRNGIDEDKPREGVVLRPVVEFTTNRTANGGRIIAKHKNDAFKETKTPREVDPAAAVVLAEAQAIADEWVTEMRLVHVLDKLPHDINIEGTRQVIDAMIEDVCREGAGEFVDSREARTRIAARTAQLFKTYLKEKLNTDNKGVLHLHP